MTATPHFFEADLTAVAADLLPETTIFGDTQHVSQPPALTRADVIAALDELATVEHALVAEYLEMSYVLGHGLLEDVPGPSGPKIAQAADAVLSMARVEMSHLLRVNRVLTLAGEQPQVGRAVAIDHSLGSGAATMFGPLGDRELLQLVERETALANAVDARYALLKHAIDPESSLFEGEILEALDFVLATCSHHADEAAELTSGLSELKSSEYLRVTRHEPADAVEHVLLALSREHYELVLAMVRATFEHDDALGGQLRNQAVTAMGSMDELHALIVQRGLLPALTSSSVAADASSGNHESTRT